MTDWFRSWHGAPKDDKWLVVAKKAKVLPGIVSAIWFALEDHASQQPDRGSVAGFSVEGYSAWSGFPEAKVAAVIAVMIEKESIVEGRLAKWDKRQPKREDTHGRGTKTKPATDRDSAPQFPTLGDTPPQDAPRVEVVVDLESQTENNNTTTAREAVADLAASLVDAAGEALGDLASYPGLASMAEPSRWIEGGCDLAFDVLPTVHRLCRAKKTGSIRTWAFFSEAVFEARDGRKAPRAPPVIDISGGRAEISEPSRQRGSNAPSRHPAERLADAFGELSDRQARQG